MDGRPVVDDYVPEWNSIYVSPVQEVSAFQAAGFRMFIDISTGLIMS